MDKNTPARFLDTAYDAYKSNPSATNQILQAAAQGAPVGLRGLAAAAAQQSQQQAQQAMAALQQQGPQPNVIQKLATQGIMSQMDTGLPIAQPLPEEAPQMMATGGLVAFADGGSVLPPDVIEAIQSHFAEGGAVQGYAKGGETDIEAMSRALRRSLGLDNPPQGVKAEIEALDRIIANQRIPMKMEESVGTPRPSYEDIYRTEAPRAGAEGKIGRSYSSLYPQAQAASDYTPYRPPVPESEFRYLNDDADYPGRERALQRISQTRGLSPEAESFVESRGRTLQPLDMPAETPRTLSLRERLNAASGSLGKPVSESLSDLGGSITPYAKSAAKKLLGTAGVLGTGYETYQTAKDLANIYGDEELGTQEKAEKVMRSGLRSGLAGAGTTIGGAFGGIPGGFIGGAGGAGLADLVMNLGEDIAGLTPESMREAKYQGVNRAITLDELKARQRASGQEIPELGTRNYPYEEEEVEGVDEPILRDPSVRKTPAVTNDQGKKIPPAQTRQVAPTPEGHSGTPEAESIPEAKKVTPEFKKASIDTSSTATGTAPAPAGASSLTAGESMGVPQTKSGLEALDPFAARDLIAELRGRKTMTPAVSKELEDLRSSARTSTILQSLLGGLGAGLSSPYGGRFALGKAALGSLAGYQKGIDAEDELGRSAFNILKGYEDAPAEEQAKAADELMLLQKAKMEEATKERVANLRNTGETSLERQRREHEFKIAHPELYTRPDYAGQQYDRNVTDAIKMYADWAKSLDAAGKSDAFKENKRREIYRQLGVESALSAGQSGLGGGPLGGQTASASGPVFITRPK